MMESNDQNIEIGNDKTTTVPNVDWSKYGLVGNRDNPRNSQRDHVNDHSFGSDIYPSGANELYAQEYVNKYKILLNLKINFIKQK